MELFFALSMAAIVIVLARLFQLQRNKAWARVAEARGLDFHTTGFMGTKPHLAGEIGGVSLSADLVIRNSGDNSQTYTVVKARSPAPLPRGLQVERQGLGGTIMAALGGQDITLGDAHLDKKLRIRGDDPAGIQAVLTAPKVAEALASLLATHRNSRIDGELVTIEEKGGGGGTLDAQLDLAIGLVEALVGATWGPWERLQHQHGMTANHTRDRVHLSGECAAGAYEVRAQLAGRSPQTTVRVPLPPAVPRGLVIAAGDSAGAVRLGDPVLDGRIAITGLPDDEVLALATGPLAEQLDLRGRLLAVLHGHPGSAVRQGAVHLVCRGAQAERAAQMVEDGLALAEGLSTSVGAPWWVAKPGSATQASAQEDTAEAHAAMHAQGRGQTQ